MSFLTDRKRAVGRGSAREGTEHFWSMTKSSVALVILVPIFVFMVGSSLGASHGEVVAYFSRPLPAVVVALTFLVGFHHFKGGAEVVVEDYIGGLGRKIGIIAVTCLMYGLAALGLFAIGSIAL